MSQSFPAQRIFRIRQQTGTGPGEIMCSPSQETGKYAFLVAKAINLGAAGAKVIPASSIVVENRVPMKCRAGCKSYGTKLTCPPYVPTPEEFRKILSEYRYALLVKFISPAIADPEIICSAYRYWLDPEAPSDKKERAAQFWKDHFSGTGAFAPLMLELERTAFNAGNPFALAFVNGSCRLCETCNVKAGICVHPTQARIPEHAVGINMVKTAEIAGMPIRFPVQGHPELMALLLIN
jgi:predicted metal-binding protein